MILAEPAAASLADRDNLMPILCPSRCVLALSCQLAVIGVTEQAISSYKLIKSPKIHCQVIFFLPDCSYQRSLACECLRSFVSGTLTVGLLEMSDEGICKNVILYYNAGNQFHKRTVTKCFRRHVRAYQSLLPIDLLR